MIAALALLVSSATVAQTKNLPELLPRGEKMVTASGKPVTLKGCNLGNWLILEMWMLELSGYKDQYEVEEILTSRFGEAEKDRLMETFYANWMKDRDWKLIKSFGFNLVRLPLNYRMFEDDRAPMKLKPNAFRWVDLAVKKAAEHGMYTIIDLHGIQGGQSVYDHTGRSEQNKVWTVESNQVRAEWLWKEFAKRYRSNPNVVAYDLFNEPYGGTKPQQVALFKRLYPVVRAIDNKKLILAMGNYDDFGHYGNPKQNGWKNVGFQMHYYPGLFGGGAPTVPTHVAHINRLKEVDKQQNATNAPFLIGEFNVVFNGAGGAGMMRRYYDLHASYGWMSTMWSYKVMSRDGGVGSATWGMVTSKAPAPKVDFRKDSKAAIESYMTGLGTMALAVNEPLRKFMVAKNPKFDPLPKPPVPILVAPANDAVPGWMQTDVGGARPGGAKYREPQLELFGGGSDIWGDRDQFRFLHQPVSGDFEISCEIEALRDTDAYAKAGVMVRFGMEPNAAATLLSVFPSGEAQFAHRETAGKEMTGPKAATGDLAGTQLVLRRTGTKLEGFVARKGKELELLHSVTIAEGPVEVGLVGLSHNNAQLGLAKYRRFSLKKL